MNKFIIELGVEVKSKISGFKGTVVARSEHLNGCNRYWVSPKVNKEGKLPDSYWFDEMELVVTKPKKVNIKNKKTGGFPSRVK